MWKGFVIGFALTLALLGMISAGASRQPTSASQQTPKDRERYRADVADATSVQVGMLAPKQRVHGALFNGFGKNGSDGSITQLIASHRHQRTVVEKNVYGRTWFSSDEPEIAEQYFARLAKQSDAIVRGRAVHKSSQITEDDSFLFTDYDVVVLDVLKNEPMDPITTQSTIEVTCAGGKIVVDDVVIKAGGNAVALLPINAQDVLLFLKYIPETRAYRLSQYNGAFELNGKSAQPLVGIFNFDYGFFKDEGSFLRVIKNLSNK
jgi:hypothetical protein